MGTDRLTILMQAHDDARNELKQRIAQRDSFTVQYTVILAAMLTIACSNYSDKTTTIALALLSVLTDFYTILMDSSYRVHNRLVEYLNSEIEPQLEKETAGTRLWEHYCKDIRRLEGDSAFGSRQKFFHIVLVCIPIVAMFLHYALVGVSPLFITYTALSIIFFNWLFI